MRHWPEYVLAALFFAGAVLPPLIVPGGILIRAASVIAGVVAAFAIWVAVIWIADKTGRADQDATIDPTDSRDSN
jgi:hypothetical protein